LKCIKTTLQPSHATHHFQLTTTLWSASIFLAKQETIKNIHRTRSDIMQTPTRTNRKDLAYRFQVSPSTVSCIFTSLVNFLHKKLSEKPIWLYRIIFPSYKNHNTARGLVGKTPLILSPLYLVMSQILDQMGIGDSVMADRGLIKSGEQLTEFELVELRRIASLRIYIERATGRIKIFPILNLRISNNLTGLSSEIFYVSTFITSFQPPLVKETR
uniref:DDE Tnp4 domain-containing protein n=2 Tax=Amphimedon queenslandica TaxID=400682 RepID=A0A1X7TMY9_AMPQE